MGASLPNRADDAAGHGAVSIQSDLLALALEEIDYAMMFLTPRGALLHANRRARLLLATGEPLRLAPDHTVSPCAGSRGEWDAAMKAASLGERSCLSVGAGPNPLACAVGPLYAWASDLRCVLVMIGRRDACDPVTMMAYARRHALTGAETRVLSMLCAGLSPAQISDAHEVSRWTVCAQIKSVYTKTGTHNIRRLLVALASLPPLRPSLQRVRGKAEAAPTVFGPRADGA